MRKFILQITIMFTCFTYSYAQAPIGDSLYQAIFIDEFNGPIDSGRWYSHYPWSPGNFCNADTTTGWCGTLLDLASMDENVLDTSNRTISGGTCKLIAKKENHLSKQWVYHPFPSAACDSLGITWANGGGGNCLEDRWIPYHYSNAMLFSRDSYKYGYFEIKFRLPGWTANYNNAVAPAFWMYDNYGSAMPWSEIDIYEINGRNGRFTNNIHLDPVKDTPVDISSDDPMPPGTEPIIDLGQWHTAAMNWTPQYIDFYLDGTFLRRSTNDTNQYLIPMPMIIENSVACGNFCDNNIDSVLTPFPQTYEIDYVKVYQVKQACDTVKAYLNTTQNSFKSKIYKSLTIGGTGGTATFNNASATAAGVDFVLLNEGFEAGANMEMTIKTENCWADQKHQIHSETIKPPPDRFLESYKINKRYND
ncbi:MAG TPA: glycoside hydrolase family 16 protein [Bacteroidia bacterium]|nr:glycoside hydrolase family 16 protein [Bacteroidia bacterium]